MTRVLRWCTLAGIVAGLLALTVPASAATGWTVVTPPASTAGAELTGSYALSDTDAWAVGGPANTSRGAPVALNWNGTAWSSVPTPTPSGSTPNWALKSVAASSTSDAWAVGEQSAGTKIHDSLYEHWNGTAWSVVAGPNEGVLNAVLDFSPTNAWAFADFSVLHWNGTAWSVVSGALPALAVSADSPDDIWGITEMTGDPLQRHLLEQLPRCRHRAARRLRKRGGALADRRVGGRRNQRRRPHPRALQRDVVARDDAPSSFSAAGVLAITAQIGLRRLDLQRARPP